MNFVYLTTNLKNGKQYVGSHHTQNENDGYLGSGRIFLKAVKKYGKENFKREILKECDEIIEARKLEEYYINEFETLIPNGYNAAPKGGIGFKGAFQSAYTKEKMSKAAKNRTSEQCSMFGKTHSEETKKLMSEKAKKRSSNMKGKKHSEETKKKMKEKALGRALNEETKKKIAETLRNRKLNNYVLEPTIINDI